VEDTQQPESRREGKLARQSSPVRLIIRHKQPSNLETPFDQLDSFITPLELFYIRSHFLTPEIELASRQTSDYAYSDYAAGNPVRRALGGVKPKSEIARPRAYERVSPSQSNTVFGAAWASETVITWIEVSTDAGRTGPTQSSSTMLDSTPGDVGNLLGLLPRSRDDTRCWPVAEAQTAAFNLMGTMKTTPAT